jgi:antitoxin (DNA-binding transcriptional repressor) of toxin-antitoxin stability system
MSVPIRRQLKERSAVLIGMNELAAHTSEQLRRLRRTGEGLLVTRRHTDVLVAITPATVRHAVEIPVRELSRHTYSVIDEIRSRGEAASVTKRGTPIATISPVEKEEALEFAAAVAAQSREFLARLERADRALAAGDAVLLDDALIDALPENRPRANRSARSGSKRGTSKSAASRQGGRKLSRAAGGAKR